MKCAYRLLPLVLLYVLPGLSQTNNPPAPPAAQSPDEVNKPLGVAYRTNVLSFASGPYHLVASFQTFNPDGTPAGDGTFERWVSSDRHSKTVTRFGGHKMTEYSDNGWNVYTDDGYVGSIMSYYARGFLDYQALPWFGAETKQLQTTATSIQGELLDCGAFQGWIEPPGYPPMPMENFCISRTTGNLVLKQTERFSVRYEDYASFLNQSIARRITASKGFHVRCRIKIEQLDQAVLGDAEMTPPPDATHASPEPSIRATKTAETTPIARGKVPPPPALKKSHAEGLVEVFILISRTGSVIDEEPLLSPSPDLEDIAMQMLKTWSYNPILRDGKPSEVITLVRLPLHF